MASFLFRKFGCRFVIIIGSLFGTTGLFLSFFTEKLWNLYITYGVMCGIGSGLIYAPSLAILPLYFDRYRYFATSFATVGGALGTLVLPTLTLKLVEIYTWRGSMLIASGFMFHIIVFGTLMKSGKISKTANEKLLSIEKELLYDPRSYLLCLESFCFGACSYTTFSLINLMVMQNGLSLESSALLLSIVGVSNMTGRVSASIISHNKRTNRPAFFASMSFLCTLMIFVIPFCFNFSTFAATLILFGVSYGARISQVSGVLIDTFGVDKLSGMIGYYLCAGGAGALSGPPLAGKIADATSSLENAFIFAAIMNLLDFILCTVLVLSTNLKRFRLNSEKPNILFHEEEA